MGVWGDTFNRFLRRGHDHGSAAYAADQAERRVKAFRAAADAGVANPVVAAELAVGKAVYARVSALMDAKPGTPEAAELSALADIVTAAEARAERDGDGFADCGSQPSDEGASTHE